MKLVFYSNYLNHHQVLVADELYEILGEGFRFVASLPRDFHELKGGEDFSLRPYCILAGESQKCHEYAIELARTADACVFGACSQVFALERAKNNPYGLAFEMGERWLKHGWFTIGSPVFRKWIWNYFLYYRKANFHKLCCGSFTAGDDERLKAYLGRHYKWGYFTGTSGLSIGSPCEDVSMKGKIRILWCARFLVWKHPELAIALAVRLKRDGYDFVIEMYGDEGNLAPHDKVYPKGELERLIGKLNVNDVVMLKGSRPNTDIQRAMQEGDIFLFTSDHLEGWGAVANESMANGCVLVASDSIGSTEFLVQHKVTGLKFQSCNLDSLYEQVKYLLDNPEERSRIAESGRALMASVWSPENAAKNLLRLIDDLAKGRDSCIIEGPCSKA